MTPREIESPERYFDRTVQDWHRRTFGDHADAIDLDLMGSCHYCREPLYLVEASTRWNKPTTILRHLAARARVPAFLVVHRDGEIVGGRGVWPNVRPIADEETLRETLPAIRNAHHVEAGE